MRLNQKILSSLLVAGLGCALSGRSNVTPAIAVGGGAVANQPSARFMALMTDGTVWAWGYNGNGEIGDGSGASVVVRKVPVVIPDFTDVQVIGSGDAWGPSMAIKSDGTAWGWGIVDNLTSSDVYNTNRPVALLGGNNISAVAAGEDSMLFLKSDGTVWAGGNNRYGQFGDGTFDTAPGLVQTHLTNTVRAIAATGWGALAVKQDGTVWAWGLVGLDANNNYLYWSTPGQVAGLTGIVDVKAGSYRNLALKQDGTVWTWAKSGGPQADTPSNQLNNVSAIAAGNFHALALRQDGTAWAWGYGSYGQLGDGTFTNLRATPAQVANLSGVASIGANDSASAALRSDGTVWTWGANYLGELGDGTTTNQPLPVKVQSLPNLYLARPTGVTASDGAYSDRVRVTWSTVSGAQSYQLWQSDLEDSSLAALLATTSDTQYDDTTAEANTFYYYWVKSVDTNGVSGFSAVDSGYYGTLSQTFSLLIKANGSTNDITIGQSDSLSITIQLIPAQYEGTPVDWWAVVLLNNSAWYYLNRYGQWTTFDVNLLNCQPAYQGGLFNLSATEILNKTGVPPGSYTFWFAVDSMDGILNLNGPIVYDSVTVTVQ